MIVRGAAAFSAGALVLGLLGTVPSGAQQAPAPTAANRDPDGISSTTYSRPAARRAGSYWTAARLRSAVPLDMAPPPHHERPRRARAAPLGDPGGPDTVAPAAGTAGARKEAALRQARAAYRSRPAPRPYTTLQERTTAKVFFTLYGIPSVCSGAVVNSRSKNMVSTAGHCVSDGFGTWARNIVVVPAFKSRTSGPNRRPFGTWRARAATTPTEWHIFSNSLQDVAYITVRKRHKRHIASRVGGIGTKFRTARGRGVLSRGYPAQAPFGGNTQRTCGPRPPAVRRDHPHSGAYPGPATMGIACNMTGGSSGGPWNGIWNGRPFQVSLNSYKYNNNHRRMFGPYFGGVVKRLFQRAVNR